MGEDQKVLLGRTAGWVPWVLPTPCPCHTVQPKSEVEAEAEANKGGGVVDRALAICKMSRRLGATRDVHAQPCHCLHCSRGPEGELVRLAPNTSTIGALCIV